MLVRSSAAQRNKKAKRDISGNLILYVRSWRRNIMEGRTTRVLLTKAEQDCHDRGVRYIATKLREAGYEVIYTNFLYPEEILNSAIQEDVDVIGLSSSCLGHKEVLGHLKKGLKDDLYRGRLSSKERIWEGVNKQLIDVKEEWQRSPLLFIITPLAFVFGELFYGSRSL